MTDDREIVLPRDRPLLVRLQQREAQKPAAPAPPTASAVEFFGALSVDSLPPGAAVFVDGQLMGKTPIVLPRVAAGAHVVRLDLSGYRRWSTAVQVSAGDRTRVAGSLEPEQFR